MDGRNGNEMAMLAVYDVEGAWHRKQDHRNFGESVRGLPALTTVSRLEIKPHIFHSVNRHHCSFVEAASNEQAVGGS